MTSRDQIVVCVLKPGADTDSDFAGPDMEVIYKITNHIPQTKGSVSWICSMFSLWFIAKNKEHFFLKFLG